MKFMLFVEGHTEHRVLAPFLKRWLDIRLNQSVGIHTIRFEGWAELVKDSPARAKLFLNAPKRDVIAVIALIDLYGAMLPYPYDGMTVSGKIEWAKKHLESKVSNDRFRQFFAVHEMEAWLLSDPAIFPSEVRASLTAKAKQPEMVNFDQPPAKFLDHLYMSHLKRHYQKVEDGVELFKKLEPDVACQKCPSLKILMDEMLRLAQESGL